MTGDDLTLDELALLLADRTIWTAEDWRSVIDRAQTVAGRD